MADVVKFVLELTDKVSPAGKKVQQTLTGIRGQVSKFAAGAGVASKGGKALGASALTVAKGFIAANVAMKAFEIGGAAVKAVAGAQAFKEQSQFALGILMKSGAEGKRVFDQILRMSQFFGEEPTETLKSYQTLLSKGFKSDDAIKTMQVLGDLKLTAPDANMESLVRAMGQIKSKPKLALEELKTQLGDAGLDLGLAYSEIGKLIGVKALDVEKAISAGKVDSNVGLLGIMNAIMASSGSKSAGEQMEKFSKTTAGLANKLKSLPDQYMLRLNVEGGAFNRLLNTITTTLDPDSPTGKKILKFLDGIGDSINNAFADISADDVLGVFDAIGEVVTGLADGLSGFFTELKMGFVSVTGPMGKFGGGAITLEKTMNALKWTLKVTGAVIGITAGLLVLVADGVVQAVQSIAAAFDPDAWNKLLGNFMDKWDALTSWLGDMGDAAWQWGADIVNGIWDGLKATWTGMITKIKGLVDLLPAAVKKTLGIASPSKVFMQLGKFSMQGFEKGVNDNAAPIERAVVGAVQPPAVGMVGSASRSTASIQWSGNVIVQVSGSNASPADIGRAAQSGAESALASFLDRLALQGAA